MRVEIRGGRVVDPASQHDDVASVYIDDGRIVAVSKSFADFNADLLVDAAGLVVIPGIVELAAHIQGSLQSGQAALGAELHAGVAGGFTTLCIPPSEQLVLDSPADVELVHQRANALALARVEVLGTLTAGLDGEHLAEMYTLLQAGCPAVSNGMVPIRSTEVMRRALQYASTFDLTVLLHCQDPWLAAERLVHGGQPSFMLGLDEVPESAETVAVARDLLLVEDADCRAHFCRLTSARSLSLVAQAKARGLRVTADTALPYLFLTHEDVSGFDSRCHVNPPFRSPEDRDALRVGLADGTLTCLVTDHQPRSLDAKMNPFPETEPGISGLDTALPLALQWMRECNVPLLRGIATLTMEPAAVVGIDRGTLAPGAVADICVFDPRAEVVIDSNQFHSRGRNTPFDGQRSTGVVSATFVGGRLVYRAQALPVTGVNDPT